MQKIYSYLTVILLAAIILTGQVVKNIHQSGTAAVSFDVADQGTPTPTYTDAKNVGELTGDLVVVELSLSSGSGSPLSSGEATAPEDKPMLVSVAGQVYQEAVSEAGVPVAIFGAPSVGSNIKTYPVSDLIDNLIVKNQSAGQSVDDLRTVSYYLLNYDGDPLRVVITVPSDSTTVTPTPSATPKKSGSQIVGSVTGGTLAKPSSTAKPSLPDLPSAPPPPLTPPPPSPSGTNKPCDVKTITNEDSGFTSQNPGTLTLKSGSLLQQILNSIENGIESALKSTLSLLVPGIDLNNGVQAPQQCTENTFTDEPARSRTYMVEPPLIKAGEIVKLYLEGDVESDTVNMEKELDAEKKKYDKSNESLLCPAPSTFVSSKVDDLMENWSPYGPPQQNNDPNSPKNGKYFIEIVNFNPEVLSVAGNKITHSFYFVARYTCKYCPPNQNGKNGAGGDDGPVGPIVAGRGKPGESGGSSGALNPFTPGSGVKTNTPCSPNIPATPSNPATGGGSTGSGQSLVTPVPDDQTSGSSAKNSGDVTPPTPSDTKPVTPPVTPPTSGGIISGIVSGITSGITSAKNSIVSGTSGIGKRIADFTSGIFTKSPTAPVTPSVIPPSTAPSTGKTKSAPPKIETEPESGPSRLGTKDADGNLIVDTVTVFPPPQNPTTPTVPTSPAVPSTPDSNSGGIVDSIASGIKTVGGTLSGIVQSVIDAVTGVGHKIKSIVDLLPSSSQNQPGGYEENQTPPVAKPGYWPLPPEMVGKSPIELKYWAIEAYNAYVESSGFVATPKAIDDGALGKLAVGKYTAGKIVEGIFTAFLGLPITPSSGNGARTRYPNYIREADRKTESSFGTQVKQFTPEQERASDIDSLHAQFDITYGVWDPNSNVTREFDKAITKIREVWADFNNWQKTHPGSGWREWREAKERARGLPPLSDFQKIIEAAILSESKDRGPLNFEALIARALTNIADSIEKLDSEIKDSSDGFYKSTLEATKKKLQGTKKDGEKLLGEVTSADEYLKKFYGIDLKVADWNPDKYNPKADITPLP